MFSVMMFSVNAVVPLLLLLALGYCLARFNFLKQEFLSIGNSLVFKVLLPMTIFHNIYTVESIQTINWKLVWFSLCVILLLFVLGWLSSRLFSSSKPTKGAFLQCTFRSNFAIIGLPLAEALGGASGAVMASVLSAFTIPLFNVLAVIVLTVCSSRQKTHSFSKILYDILTNPLIIAAAAGLVCLLIRSFLPLNSAGLPVFTIQNQLPFLFKAITWLHQSSGPLALIIMGGMLDFSKMRSKLPELIGGTIFRLVVAPVFGLLATYFCCEWGWISCGPGEYGTLLALFGAPVAVSSAIMATSMECDGELARQYVVWTAAFSMFSLFCFAAILRFAGLL